MKMTDERIEELARIQTDLTFFLMSVMDEAYRNGQESMRESAASKLLEIGALGDGDFLDTIRALPIEGVK